MDDAVNGYCLARVHASLLRYLAFGPRPGLGLGASADPQIGTFDRIARPSWESHVPILIDRPKGIVNDLPEMTI